VIQFLIDENLSPALRDVANSRGYNAYAIQYLNWKGYADEEIARRLLAEDLTIVTANWIDFRRLLKNEEVHPGAIWMPSVSRERQIELFEAALDHLEGLDPPEDMVNRLMAVEKSGVIDLRAWP
jgi:predicted nuclease of predicted toxin-antitoxin system